MYSQTPQDLDRETDRLRPDESPEPRVATLLSEILGDFQRLVKQHLDLFKHEVREDVRKSKQAVTSLVVAYMLGWLGVMLLSAMVVGLLAWAVPQVPWWGWAGIVGVAVCLAAASMIAAAKKKFASITPLPTETAKAIKEDLQWLRK